MQKLVYILLIVLVANKSIAQVNKIQTGQRYPITITFQNRVDSQILSLDSSYTNPHGETFTVRNFRYYIKSISVIENSGDHIYKIWQLPESYFLIDERKLESKSISFQIPFANISSIQFSIGIDSIKNVSGVQTGALDPANGMFWTWNSGYIFAKLEGVSPQSKAPANNFTYHIGGFRSSENAVRQVVLPIDRQLSPKENSITIAANVNAWFAGNNAIKIAEQPATMQPGKLSMQIADNYSRMFSIVK